MKTKDLETRRSAINGTGVFTNKKIVIADHIFDVQDPVYSEVKVNRDKYTVELNGKHYLHVQLKYVNHSKFPNMWLDKEFGFFRALRNIEAGEELTFDYTDTESEFDCPFAELYL